jgi:hypothetical protein
VLSDADKASGAAFFLADACPAMIALQASAGPDVVADALRRDNVIAAIDRGTRWLTRNATLLEQADRAAPNRLLYDALAFHSCGVLTNNAEAKKLSTDFVARALRQTEISGVFIEQGGSDTTYQAVSVRLALDLLLTGYEAENATKLSAAWQSGAVWLGRRIMDDGRIDSTENSRTCNGGESFMGVEKKVWPPGVYGALIYAAELIPNDDLQAGAARLSAWARANPRADPCYSN